MNHIRSIAIAFAALCVALTGGVAYATHPGGANTISTVDIINGQVQQPDIAAEAVGTDQIKNNQVRSPDIKSGEVMTDDIADAAVAIAKLGFDPATQSELNQLASDDGDGPNTGSNLLHWSRLTGVPSGFADGTDDAAAAGGWLLGGNAGTTGADFLGTTDNQALELRVNGARALRLQPASDGTNQSPNVIGGSADNSITAGVHSAAIGGGGRGNPAFAGTANRVTDNLGTIGGGADNQAGDGAGMVSDRAAATVAGGFANRAVGQSASVGGGVGNLASGAESSVSGGQSNQATQTNAAVGGGVDNLATQVRATIGGGISNRASGLRATVGGGQSNRATGTDTTVGGGANGLATGLTATVPGGSQNEALGDYTFAAGRRARAQAAHNGAFVWADSTNLLFPSTAANQFSVRATGGTRLVSGVDGSGAPTSGLELPASTSDLSTLGTGQPFDVRVNGSRALRLEPASDGTNQSPNVIGGSADNAVSAGVYSATIAGGGRNTAGVPVRPNRVTDHQGTVGGGAANLAGDDAGGVGNRTLATVAGGGSNEATGQASSVGGGLRNFARGAYSTVPGGSENTAQGDFSVAGGFGAQALHEGSIVWADSSSVLFPSTADDQFSVRSTGGVRLVSGTDGVGTPTSGVELPPNTNGWSTIVDSQPFDIRVNGSRGLRIQPSYDGADQSPNVIGGTGDNAVSFNVHSATIAGGGRGTPTDPTTANRVTDHQGTVGGGANNQAGDGDGDVGNRTLATVGGGGNNKATGEAATVAGGFFNTASGSRATVAGGESNSADGPFSFAAGKTAQANHQGAFVWADSTVGLFGGPLSFASTAADEFSVRARGGVRFVTAVDATNGNPTAGVTLAPGAGSWSSLSDEASKRAIEPVSGRSVLRELASVPISTWGYRSQDESIRHVGPMAQDFYRAFGVGESRRRISSVDADGVALAAIQGLSNKLRAERRRRHEQERRLDRLEARLAALEGR